MTMSSSYGPLVDGNEAVEMLCQQVVVDRMTEAQKICKPIVISSP